MEKITRPYEVLVRIHPGGVEEAHVRCIEEITDGATVVAARELPATPLALAGPEFGALVAEINQTALVERDSLTVKVAALEAEIDALKRAARVR